MPEVSCSDCSLKPMLLARFGVSGTSAVLNARYGVSAKTTSATAPG
jgi:hypothetical protein